MDELTLSLYFGKRKKTKESGSRAHTATLHEPISPLIISFKREGRFHYFMIRVKEGQAADVTEQLSSK